jgi:hypothetical protein
MTTHLHPDFLQHAYPVAVSLARKYSGYVEADDIRSDLIEWGYHNHRRVDEWLSAEDEKVLKTNIWILGKRMNKQGERFCRKMKAQVSGYHHTDEWFFNRGLVRELLPLVYDGSWRETLRGEPEGGRKPPREPSTGGNLPAMAIDIEKVLPKLSVEQRSALEFLYLDKMSEELAAMELEITVHALKARVDRAVERIVELTGGDTPWDGLGSRRIKSNAQASVETSRNN